MHGLLRRASLAVLLSGLIVHVQAGTPPDIPKEIARLQSRCEPLLTLKQLTSIPPSLLGVVSADKLINTELIARQAISRHLAGQSVDTMTAALVALQNTDGGFGSDVGFASNPLDTAWALLALVQNNQTNSAAAASARTYLVASVKIDGGMAGLSNVDRMQNSALALLALQASQADLSIATVVRNLVTWLQQHQTIDAGYVGNYQAVDAIRTKDTFIFAVALRTLSLLAAPIAAQAGALTGQVFDANSGATSAGPLATCSM